MKRNRLFISNPLVLTLFVMVAIFFSNGISTAAPVTITAAYVPSITTGLDPAGKDWKKATEVSVPLDTLITDTQALKTLLPPQWRWVKVKAIHNGADIYFRLQWTDSTVDTTVADTPLFADAFAIQFPFPGYASSAPIEMGSPSAPVNIIFWRANMADPATGIGHPQNIVAGGVGTVQTSPDSNSLPITSFQSRAGSTWTLVIKRPMSGGASANGNMVTLSRNSNYRIMFGNWNGATQERNGVKLVNGSWQTMVVK